VYQSYAYAQSGIGSRLAWQLPAADGTYTLRLHFAEPWTTTVGDRKFDIRLQGTTVTTNYDIYATAGARYKATVLSYPVTAAGGTGIALELVNKTSNEAVLCGIELLTDNATGTAAPTATVEVSADNGVNWTTLATGVAFDRWGRGQLAWTPTVETEQALVRVRANQGTQPADVSDRPFLVASNGTLYYVNDGSLTGDLLATAPGDNRNSGKSPGKPMSSLAALVSAYDLDAGDLIHIDTGTYGVVRNVVLGSEDSGVRIEGPAVGVATLNRGNSSSGSYVVELAGADDVTLSRLTLTGASYGIYGSSTANSDRFRLEQSVVTANANGNVYLESSNDDAAVVQSILRNSGSGYGLRLLGSGTLVVGNTVFGNSYGISLSSGAGFNGRVQGNEVHNNSYGIAVDGSSSTGALAEVTGNLVHHNTWNGIGSIRTRARPRFATTRCSTTRWGSRQLITARRSSAGTGCTAAPPPASRPGTPPV